MADSVLVRSATDEHHHHIHRELVVVVAHFVAAGTGFPPNTAVPELELPYLSSIECFPIRVPKRPNAVECVVFSVV